MIITISLLISRMLVSNVVYGTNLSQLVPQSNNIFCRSRTIVRSLVIETIFISIPGRIFIITSTDIPRDGNQNRLNYCTSERNVHSATSVSISKVSKG